MNNFSKKNKFTFLELMIAVIIFLIVSVVITSVYRTALNAYKKGTEYSDISQSLSGTFLVMENDLNKLVTINDKDAVFFKPEEFSFISVGLDQSKHSFLQQVKYKLQDNMLLRSSVKYPDDIVNIDREPVLFLNNIDETSFKYTYQKEEKKKKKGKSSDKENGDKGNLDSKGGNSKSDEKKNKISKDDESDSNIKIPLGIDMSGLIKNKNLVQDYKTTLFVPQFKIQKMSKSKDDKKGKDKDKDKSNNNNDNNSNNSSNQSSN